MKNFVILFLCVVCVAGCSQKRPAVIERPVFDVSNTTIIEIEKIEMSDTATIFSIHAFYRPGWYISMQKGTSIRESGSDEKLLLTKAEGIPLDENFYFPDSGETEFKLFFPPLKPEITKIDFIENDCETCFKIFGIRLLPGEKVEIASAPSLIAEDLPVPTYSNQPARISGQILGYVKGALMNLDAIDINYLNPLTLDQQTVSLPIADDGSFSGEVSIGIPCFINTRLGSLFLAPDKETKIVFDLKKQSRYQSHLRTDKAPDDSIYIYQSGCGLSGADVSAISTITKNFGDYRPFIAEVMNMKPDEYKNFLLAKMNATLDGIKQSGKSENVQLLMGSAAKLTTLLFLINYESIVTIAHKQVSTNAGKIETQKDMTFKAEKPGEDYYSFLREILDDRMSYLPNYVHIVRQMTGIASAPNQPTKDNYAYIKEKLTNLLGTDHGILFDLVQAQLYGISLQDMQFYTPAEKEEIKTAFARHPEYGEALIAENDRIEKLMEDNKNNGNVVVNEPPKVANDKLFAAIMAKYKGKVVLVDFWATWCTPCLQAMKSILPMKEEMKGKDVVFLYITGETSPLAKWNTTIPTIHGEHYRLNNAQYGYLGEVFGIQGIPTYLVCDKQGKQTYKSVGFPGVVTMKAEIEKDL
jgi:thiol-disulfide isomerase/thioredoxin